MDYMKLLQNIRDNAQQVAEAKADRSRGCEGHPDGGRINCSKRNRRPARGTTFAGVFLYLKRPAKPCL